MLVEPEPTTLVALTNCADPTMLVSAKVTEGLLSYDFELRPRPQLATGWSVSADGLRLIFTLRQGVRWHDGSAFTSADVAFSMKLLKEMHPRGRATFAALADVETPDPHTAILVLSQPAPFLLSALAACESPIMPRHIDPIANGNAPIGTGPFRFKEWVRGSHIAYERNTDYWDSPKPFIDTFVVTFVEDADARIAALESGAIDLAPATPVPFDRLPYLRGLPNIAFETDGYQYTNQVVRLEFNLDDPTFRDRRVRQAIAHAIDRQALIDKAWFGYGLPAFGPISPDLPSFCLSDLGTPAFDPAAAEHLLDAAGLPRGPDGLRLRLPMDYVPAGDGYKLTADEVAVALARIGIAATVRVQDFPAYIRRVYTDRDFHFSIGRMNNMFDPTVGVQRVFWSKNIKRGVPFSNGAHYRNDTVDRLLEQAAVEPDPVERHRLFAQFQRTVVGDLPDVTLLAPKQITIANRRVIDHTLTADGPAANLADVRRRA